MYPPSQYAGIVVLRQPDDAVAQEIVGVIERFFNEHQVLDALNGRLAIVETAYDFGHHSRRFNDDHVQLVAGERFVEPLIVELRLRNRDE